MQKLKLAIIGCDGMPFNAIYDCMKTLPVELRAVCGTQEETARFAARYTVPAIYGYDDYKKMLAEQSPRIVIVFSPVENVAEISAECMRAGAYVYAERPVCFDTASMEKLIKLQEDTGCYTVPRFHRHHAPAYMMAREIVNRKEFGRRNMFMGKFQAAGYNKKDLLWLHISHLVDTARFFVGEITLLHTARSVSDKGETCFNISFSFAEGGIGVIQSGTTQCLEYPMERIEIAGQGCNVIVDNYRHIAYNRQAPLRLENKDMVLKEGGDTLVWNLNPSHIRPFSQSGLDGEMENLVSAAMNGTRPDFDLTDALGTVRALAEIERTLVDIR